MADVASASVLTATNGQARMKKPYVRVITDKRREQNRRAQKVYREKLKKKLDGLEEQVASQGSDYDQAAADNSLPDEAATTNQPQATVEDAPIPSTNIINFDDIFTAGGDLPIESSIAPSFHFPIATASATPLPQSTSPPVDDGEVYKPLDIWRMPHRPAGTPYSPPPTASASYMSSGLTTIPSDHAHPHQVRRLQSSPKSPHTSQQNSRLPSPYANNLTLTSETNLTATLSIALSLGISSTAYLEDHPSLFPTCFDEWWPSFSSPNPSLLAAPDFLTFTQSSYDPIECKHLMLTRQRLSIGNTSHTFVHGTRKVRALEVACPKFRAAAWATTHGHDENSPDKLRRHMSRIKHPLRPRPVQLLHSHPSYLDCIVFPRFRERAVQASVDGTLDHVEFFLDLMHGGLVCWGNSNPHGGSRRNRRRGMVDAMPWSTRSWEARRWFLEKWGWLVGSQEEEEAEGDSEGIWGSSRWWWEVRGEVDSDDSDGDDDGDESEEAALRDIYEGFDRSGQGADRFDLRGADYEH